MGAIRRVWQSRLRWVNVRCTHGYDESRVLRDVLFKVALSVEVTEAGAQAGRVVELELSTKEAAALAEQLRIASDTAEKRNREL